MRPASTPTPRPGVGVRVKPYQRTGYGDFKRSVADYYNGIISYNGMEKTK